MKTGGFGGVFDTPEKLASKLYSFRHKLMNVIDEKELLKISGNKFLDKAKKICSKNENKFYSLDTLRTEIFQFDVIVILPGQELPMHLDMMIKILRDIKIKLIVVVYQLEKLLKYFRTL